MLGGMADEQYLIRAEFTRAAAGFGARTAGRFDALDAPGFSRLRPGEVVAEVGAGSGGFLGLFAYLAGALIAVDLTPAMLAQAQARLPGVLAVVGDGANLPLRTGSVDLVACAQVLHHVRAPVPLLAEMARAAAGGGRVLIVDQVATERFEEAAAMTWLERVRDPSHAASRSPSMLRLLCAKAGLDIVDERLHEDEQRLSGWMWPGEFPPERIAAVRRAIEEHGAETGMGFRRDGADWVFVRRRMMVLARPRRDA